MYRIRRLSLITLAAFLVLLGFEAGGTALASHLPALVPHDGLDSTTILAQDGFGDSQNSYAWSMAWFNGKLYVGTGRDVVCVEKETTDFYYPFAHEYKTNPEPSVHCAKDPYNLDLRAEIWQYTPQTQKWVMVYRAPQNIRNPRAPGKFVSPDIAFRGMTVATAPDGRKALFVSGVSADEYIPELYVPHPPQILRTYDGTHFTNIVSSSFIVHRTGEFTDARPMGFRGLIEWKQQLYTVASTSLTGDGSVFRIDDPWSAHAHFVQVSPSWMVVFELDTFHGWMYFGAGNGNTGYSVWRVWNNKTYKVQPIVTDGAGRGHYVTGVISMQAYHGWLYVAAVGWYCITCDALPIVELIRIAPDGYWQVVVGDPRFVASLNRTLYPISGLDDGFSDVFNSHMWRMTVVGNALYIGTLNWSWLLQTSPTVTQLDSLLQGETGFNIWATCDGEDFFPVTRNAFGVDGFDFGVRTMVPVNGGVYIGSANHAHGTRIYYTDNACAPLISPSRRGARSAHRAAVTGLAAPQDLLTDVQRRGTVLSWEPSPHAVRYQVLRSEDEDISFSYTKPLPLSDGFLPDDASPMPVAAGTPGSLTTTLDFPGTFAPLGTTTGSYYIAPAAVPGVKYEYEVVAEARSGARSETSNVQVVPDPRPSATYAQLEAAMPRSQLELARAASGKVGCASTLAELARLSRTASNAGTQELAYRLERRLRYRNVAGGPVAGSLACG